MGHRCLKCQPGLFVGRGKIEAAGVRLELKLAKHYVCPIWNVRPLKEAATSSSLIRRLAKCSRKCRWGAISRRNAESPENGAKAGSRRVGAGVRVRVGRGLGARVGARVGLPSPRTQLVALLLLLLILVLLLLLLLLLLVFSREARMLLHRKSSQAARDLAVYQ